MNALEEEYRDNLQRVKRKQDRRRVVVAGLYLAFIFVMFLTYLIRGEVTTRDFIATLPLAAMLAAIATFRLARYFFKWFEDRNVEVTTTERERAYREPVTITQNDDARPAKPRLLLLVALIPAGVVAFALGVLTDVPHHIRTGSRLIALGVTLTFAGIILVAKRVYGTWRARRNARLELQWEKWLDSADSCEVGSRKWTK